MGAVGHTIYRVRIKLAYWIMPRARVKEFVASEPERCDCKRELLPNPRAPWVINESGEIHSFAMCGHAISSRIVVINGCNVLEADFDRSSRDNGR